MIHCCLRHLENGTAPRTCAGVAIPVNRDSKKYVILLPRRRTRRLEQGQLAKWLVENSCADRVFFCNSGGEANEAAIKVNP